MSFGTCIGKFTKTQKFRLHITALEFLAPYAKVSLEGSHYLWKQWRPFSLLNSTRFGWSPMLNSSFSTATTFSNRAWAVLPTRLASTRVWLSTQWMNFHLGSALLPSPLWKLNPPTPWQSLLSIRPTRVSTSEMKTFSPKHQFYIFCSFGKSFLTCKYTYDKLNFPSCTRKMLGTFFRINSSQSNHIFKTWWSCNLAWVKRDSLAQCEYYCCY